MSVPLGFRPIKKKKTYDVCEEDIANALHKKRLHSVVWAQRQGNTLELTEVLFRCPNCGRDFSALQKPEDCEAQEEATLYEHLKSIMASAQELLFRPKKERILLHTLPKGDLICPRCGAKHSVSNQKCNITILVEKTHITVSRVLQTMEDILSVSWLDKLQIAMPCGLAEEICFDFSSGSCRFLLRNGAREAIAERMLNGPADGKGDPLVHLINERRVVRRNLRRAFEFATGQKMPFSCNELNMEYFVLFTKFQGFNRGFYDAVPFSADPFRLDFTFDYIVSRLKTPESAMRSLKDSALPFTKSVKRIFANNQGLFFYIKDCELLYSALKDINYLVPVLKSDCIYTILLILHKSPQAIEFIKALFETKGIGFMCKFFSLPFYDHFQTACCYSALLPEYKSTVRSSLKKYTFEDFRRFNYFSMLKISYPCSDIIRRIPEKTVNGFSFKWFSNLHSCWQAGEKLKNCLADWDTTRSAVAGMFHGTALIAALEIRPYYKGGYEITQAYGKRNADIEKDSAVYSAIVRWCEMFNVKYKRFFEER